MSIKLISSIHDIDPVWDARSEEDRKAIESGSLCAPGRKLQCFGLPTHWRQAGPFDWTGCDDVVVMPGRLSGVPTVGPSRFSADNLLGLHEDGLSLEQIVEDYPLEPDLVRRVLDFAAARKATAKAA